jgi:hypothetical protein
MIGWFIRTEEDGADRNQPLSGIIKSIATKILALNGQL